MLQIERLEKIKEYVARNEYADINDLAKIFEVSTATIRRSLKRLENEKIIELTRGGATLVKKGNLYEHPYFIKKEINIDEKRRIAAEAAKMIRPNESIFLDSSTTVYEMAKHILKMNSIMAATNDLMIAEALTDAEHLSVSVIGGTLRKHYFTLTGYFAEALLKDLCFDCAFLGIDSANLRGGLMITNIEEVQIKRKIVEVSNRVIVLCDHSKFEQASFLSICGFDKIDTVITGKELDQETARKYIDAGVKMIFV